MTSYENFWLATAAAVPVIALAAVVALPDTSGIYDELQNILDDMFGTRPKLRATLQAAGASEPTVEAVSDADISTIRKATAKRLTLLRVIAAVIRWTAIGNVLLQAVLLAFSLAALAYSVNVMPRWLAIVLTVGGILLLAATVSLASEYRQETKKFPKVLERGILEKFKHLMPVASETGEGSAAEKQVSSSNDSI